MSEIEKRIKELIQPVFDDHQAFLMDISLRGSGNQQVLTIVADTLSGITLDQITAISREVEDILDMHDPIKGRYRLEISSPGLSWPLKEDWQFERNIGRKLRVIYQKEPDKEYEVKGDLLAYDSENIKIKTKKEELTIPRMKILKATVQLKW
ncbi:MAG: ribosome maturation factor RimP [Calditrichia bacterium]